jgi:hypothetical protein
MRYSNLIGTLPHPILCSSDVESSYADGTFRFDMQVDRDKRPHQLKVEYEIRHPSIQNLIENDSASVALAIRCQQTYFYEVLEIPKGTCEQSLTFQDRDVMGHVHFNLIVIATKAIPDFRPEGLIGGYEGLSFNIRQGDVLAISDEIDEYYALPPMKLGENIFLLELQPELDPEVFNLDLQEDKIKIGVGSELNDLLQRNMETRFGKAANIGTVYFPALIETLYQVREESHDGKMWYETLSAAANRVGVETLKNVDDWQPLELAQKLLRNSHVRLLEMEVR